MDTFQYSCLTTKDVGINQYTDFVTVFYGGSMNANVDTILACPTPQFVVISSVRSWRGR